MLPLDIFRSKSFVNGICFNLVVVRVVCSFALREFPVEVVFFWFVTCELLLYECSCYILWVFQDVLVVLIELSCFENSYGTTLSFFVLKFGVESLFLFLCSGLEIVSYHVMKCLLKWSTKPVKLQWCTSEGTSLHAWFSLEPL